MTNEAAAEQIATALRALGAAIAESADLCGLAGSALHRSQAEFATFTTRFDEVAGSTKEQLEQALKAIDYFHQAATAARSSLECAITSNAATDTKLLVPTQSECSPVSSEASFPLPSPNALATVPNFADASNSMHVGEIKAEEGEKESSNNNCETVKKEFECPECEQLLSDAPSWVAHLRSRHLTAPVLAGYLLRCDCGHESYSYSHSNECVISNYTVIRTKVTPQCFACEKYPTTAFWFMIHLMTDHETSLADSGIYLQCSCGFKITDQSAYLHRKKCQGRDFSICRADERED